MEKQKHHLPWIYFPWRSITGTKQCNVFFSAGCLVTEAMHFLSPQRIWRSEYVVSCFVHVFFALLPFNVTQQVQPDVGMTVAVHSFFGSWLQKPRTRYRWFKSDPLTTERCSFFWIPRPQIQKTTFSDIGSPSYGQIRHIKQDFVSGLPGNWHPFFDGRAVCSWSKRAGRCCCGPLPIPSYLPRSLAPSVQDVQRSASGSEKMASERTWIWFDLYGFTIWKLKVYTGGWFLYVFIGER